MNDGKHYNPAWQIPEYEVIGIAALKVALGLIEAEARFNNGD